MTLTIAAVKTVLKLIVMAVAGFIAAKNGALNDERINALSVFLKSLLLPCMLISVGFRAYDSSMLKQLLAIFLISFVSQGMGYVFALIFIRKNNNPHWPIEHASCSASNVGFIGTAVVSMMLGPEALIYMIGPMTACNLLLFTIGEGTVAGGVNLGRLVTFLKSSTFIFTVLGIVLYITQPPIPDIITEPISTMGGMIGTVAMIIAGAMLQKTDVKSLLSNYRTYLVMIIKCVLSPLCVIPAMLIFPNAGYYVGMVAFLCSACPIPSLVPIFALEYGEDAPYASGLLAISMVFAMIAIPLDVALYSFILNV